MKRMLDHHQAEAMAAMKKAASATSSVERLKWLQAAVAWNELARLVERKVTA